MAAKGATSVAVPFCQWPLKRPPVVKGLRTLEAILLPTVAKCACKMLAFSGGSYYLSNKISESKRETRKLLN